MFTGIVEELGEVVAVEPLPDQAARLSIRGPLVVSDAGEGDSIAVNGVCLTVVDHVRGRLHRRRDGRDAEPHHPGRRCRRAGRSTWSGR